MVCSLYSQWFRGVYVRKNGVCIMLLKATKVQQGGNSTPLMTADKTHKQDKRKAGWSGPSHHIF